MPQLVLPPKYYLNHFFEFIEFIEIHYESILEYSHRRFIEDFRQLSENAQCVYIRMVNRKGVLFDPVLFSKYSEIQQPTLALEELRMKGFSEKITEANRIDLIYFLTKAKLRQWLLRNEIVAPISASRDQLVEIGLQNIPKLNLSVLDQIEKLAVQSRHLEIEYLLFLYFGRVQKSLNLYTLRDLGIRQSNTLKNQFKPRFASSKDAQAEYFFTKCLEARFELLTKFELNQLVHQALQFQEIPSSTQKLKDALLMALAENLLPVDDELGLAALNESQHPAAREKAARHLYKRERKEEVLHLLERIQAQPRSDEELLFAEDFLSRKFNKKKQGYLTEVLNHSKQIVLSDFYLKRPEWGVSEHYRALGYKAIFTENDLWNSLFGILFWEELFLSEAAAIHNPFERSPSDLAGPDFYAHHAEKIEHKLVHLKNDHATKLKILATITENYGRLNDIFQWRTTLADTLISFLKYSGNQNVAAVLRAMAKNFESQHSGFPDLMIEKDGMIQFIEVKAEGDSLRPNQLGKMRLLKEAGFEVEVLRVQWQTDPHQVYVVVDVETTGGSAPLHRVTEIGAVKIQNGQIIDEFQTLINPGRPIPAFITGITGITNEMVATAPAFSEIAERFLTFLEGAIFVAHNVKFDYGFIQREFARCAIEFVRPHICTCAGMRKAYPGIKSYGLKNLTSHFQITLTQHHRALADARAAAELLLLMNQKRGPAATTQVTDTFIDRSESQDLDLKETKAPLQLL